MPAFYFLFPPPPRSSSSFSKCCLLSTWAEEEVKAEKTNAGCQIAGVGWEGEGSESSCPAGSGRRCRTAHESPHRAGATGAMLVSAAQQQRRKVWFWGENKLCRSFGALRRQTKCFCDLRSITDR